MPWSLKDSSLIYDELRRISATILKKIGCHTEPHEINGKGATRTRPWREIGGQNRYQGILYHYTGGISMLKTLKWGNHPGWGNTSSSWHVTIADRIPDNVIGEEWSNIDDELRRLFPVPTVIMADWRWGTWHGNWTNDVLLGVENRNSGYHGYAKAYGGLKGLGKKGVKIGNRTWEEYTREQMVCNVNIGRLANGWIDDQLNPDRILTHMCVWSAKMDCGLAYGIHDVRNSIFNSIEDLNKLEWLGLYPMAPDTNEDDDSYWGEINEIRYEDPKDFIGWVNPTDKVKSRETDLDWVARQLYKLGFNTGPETPLENRLRKQVQWFQRSTSCFKDHKPEWYLVPDGIAGPRTEAGIRRRLDKFRILV